MSLNDPYVLRCVFVWCDASCQNRVFKVCKLWRSYYKWINPRQSYLKSIEHSNFTFAKQLLDWCGFDFLDDTVFVKSIVKNGEMNSYVMAMLDRGSVNPTIHWNCAIKASSEYGHFAIVDKLLQDSRTNPAANFNFAIRYASQNGHLDVVDRLLQHPRVDPSDNFWFHLPITAACVSGNLPVVNRLLQDPRVDPSVDHNYAIIYASEHGNQAVVERLLQDHRVDPSANDNSALHVATQHGHTAIVALLERAINSRIQMAAPAAQTP